MAHTAENEPEKQGNADSFHKASLVFSALDEHSFLHDDLHLLYSHVADVLQRVTGKHYSDRKSVV